MYKKSDKTEKRKDEKRKSIVHAAIKVFSEKGYNDTSIKNITDEAQVSVGTFYSYFTSKEDIILRLYDKVENVIIDIASSFSTRKKFDIAKGFTCSIAEIVLASVRNEELTRMLFVKCLGADSKFEEKYWQIFNAVKDYLRKVLFNLREKKHITASNTETFSIMLTQSVFGMILYWLNSKDSMNIEEMTFSLLIYNMRALKIDFNEDDVKKYINEVLSSGGNLNEI